MLEEVGILVVCYGSRGVSIVDALTSSVEYKTKLFIVDKQRNPYNIKRSHDHVVIPDFDVKKIAMFTDAHHDEIDFGIVGPEKPIINGIRDVVEKETKIPILCPTKKFAIEASKVSQRFLLEEVAPETNPRFKVFDPNDYSNSMSVREDLDHWLDELNNQVVVKPDKPAAGKGVGVWGDHFNNRTELFNDFLLNFKYGKVIVEEKLIGEESSFQAFCDGEHLVPLPETRDYKRAFDGDKGPNTGGMGSYKDVGNVLPFMTNSDWDREIHFVNELFHHMKGSKRNPDLRGVPFYVAFMHTASGPKVLEINSRPGDPEIMNILPIIKDDFVEVCLRMIEGELTRINLEDLATVVTYKVPPTYAGKEKTYTGSRIINLQKAYSLCDSSDGRLRLYPGALELKNGKTEALSSRTVALVGIGKNIQVARQRSLEGVKAVEGGSLWNRRDIASREHIQKSVIRMNSLRGGV
jgi:phosphoribosylamine--glycine ligase